MNGRVFQPSSRYLTKIRWQITIIILVSYLALSPLAFAFGSENPDGDILYLAISGGVAVVSWLIGMLLSGPYYRSLRYEVMDDEVIVRVGIVTSSVKHVPYRTVTNITIQRGVMDRWFFNIGTLKIQTAGMSGNTGAEESLVGLPDVQSVYDLVVTALRRFRGSMAPTAADEDIGALALQTNGELKQLMADVHAIRLSLEKGG